MKREMTNVIREAIEELDRDIVVMESVRDGLIGIYGDTLPAGESGNGGNVPARPTVTPTMPGPVYTADQPEEPLPPGRDARPEVPAVAKFFGSLGKPAAEKQAVGTGRPHPGGKGEAPEKVRGKRLEVLAAARKIPQPFTVESLKVHLPEEHTEKSIGIVLWHLAQVNLVRKKGREDGFVLWEVVNERSS